MISSTPELVLPPDFGKKATKSNQANKRDQFSVEQQFTMTPPVETTQPRGQIFLRLTFIFFFKNSIKESLEKFKMNKRFTIGEWVYGFFMLRDIKRVIYIIGQFMIKDIIFHEDLCSRSKIIVKNPEQKRVWILPSAISDT